MAWQRSAAGTSRETLFAPLITDLVVSKAWFVDAANITVARFSSLLYSPSGGGLIYWGCLIEQYSSDDPEVECNSRG